MRNLSVLFCLVGCVLFSSCIFSESWDSIYQKQNSLFQEKRNVFDSILKQVDDLKFPSDTIIIANEFVNSFGKELSNSLLELDILSVEYRQPRLMPDRRNVCRDILFELGEKWYRDRFSVLTVRNSECDERSKNGYHWKMEGSEHKHSFGFGNGWFLYSDSDRDPF